VRCLSGILGGLLLAGVAACGVTDSDASRSTESDGTASSEASGSPTPSDSTDANAAVRGALSHWRRADTGKFTQTATFPGGSVTTSGLYQLSTRTSRTSAAFESPDGQHFDIRVIAIRDTNYLNGPWSGGLSRCWLRSTTESIGAVTGLETVAGAGGLPANVVALSYARGKRTSTEDDDLVLGTVDLVSAASMFGSGVLKLFDDSTLTAPIAAEFTIADGEVASWRMTGEDLVAAMDSEGLLDGIDNKLRDGLEDFDVEVEYDQVGSAEAAVRPPDRAHVMSGQQLESHEGCSASR
jgi:hypothetical protein